MFENGADYLRRQAINLSATNGRQSLRIEQWQQTAPGVERDQVIAATDVGLANKNLRHRAPTGDRHHFVALRRIGVNANFFKLRDASGFENLFGLSAIGTNGGGVNFDVLHRFFLISC